MDDFANQNKHPCTFRKWDVAVIGWRKGLWTHHPSAALLWINWAFLWGSNLALFHIPKSTIGNSFVWRQYKCESVRWVSDFDWKVHRICYFQLLQHWSLLLITMHVPPWSTSCSIPQSSLQSGLHTLPKLYVYMPHLRTNHDLRYCCVFDLSL